MYFFSVMKNLFRKNNIGMIIYFFLNMIIIFGLFANAGPQALEFLFIAYLLSIVIATSFVGETIFAAASGSRKMKRLDDRGKMEPILRRVYDKARLKTPDLPEGIVLRYVQGDRSANAFALGRRTICVTEGLIFLPEEQIEGILAHEIGHLAYHHTDIPLLIGGGNFLVTIFVLILQAIYVFCMGSAAVSTVKRKGCLLATFGFASAAFIWLWLKFCLLFLRWSNRANEFEADQYAYELGYGEELAEVLDRFAMDEPRNTFLKAMYSTHPVTDDRIAQLQRLGVHYSRVM